MYPRKHHLQIEHASGRIEKIYVSHPIAIIIIDNLIQDGWPWMSITVNGQTIKSKPDPRITNRYETTDGKEFLL